MEYTFIKSEEIMDWEGRKRARFVNSLSGFKSATLIGSYHPEFGDNLSIVSSVVHLGIHSSIDGIRAEASGE